MILRLLLAAVPVIACAAWLRHMTRRHGLGPLLWRWHSGHTLDGVHRTNATWTKRSYGNRPVLHPTGHAVRWHHLPRLHRAGIRDGAELMALVVLYGLLADRTATLVFLAVAAVAGLALAVWCGMHAARDWQHQRHYVRPLEGTIIHKLRMAPESIEVKRAGDVVTGVVIEWPPHAEIGAPEQRLALEAVTERLPIEAPDAKWELKGRARSVVYTQSEPPPFPVSWEDIAPSVERAAFNELVFGLGKRGAIVTAKYSDSPHLCIPGGSGGGKSNLAAVLLLIELMRGSLIVNLDPKWTSHLWLQGLPNVINAHDTPDLHLALCWLGRELKRRTRAAYYSANGTGRVRGRVGDRIVVLCEELNYGMPDLKDYHAELRAQDRSLPKRSPAISALQGLACAGRASDIHAWLIAQLLTVESTGVKDSTIRTNAGIKAMVRHDKPGWDMAVGKHVPMPQPSDTPGRIHVVTSNGTPRETQVPYLHLVPEEGEDPAIADEAVKWARGLAVSGTVAQIPTGPEGVPPQLWPSSVVRQERPALPAGQGPETGTTVAGMPSVPPALTIREAVEMGVFGDLALGAARRRVQRARLQEAGERDGAKEYLLSELHALAKGIR